jgi:hypothetical protein
MSFTAAWDESQPDGAVVDAADLDLWDRNIQRNIRERLEALLGITDFVAQTPAAGTTLKGIKLDMRGTAASSLLPGATSFAVRNNADTFDNLLIADNGDVTVRNNLIITGTISTATLALTGHLTVSGQATVGEHDAGNSGAAIALDFNNGNNQLLTLTATCTLTLSNPVTGSVYIIRLKQDATGSRFVTWPGTVDWGSAGAPTLTTTAERSDLIALYWNGTKYVGSVMSLGHNV